MSLMDELAGISDIGPLQSLIVPQGTPAPAPAPKTTRDQVKDFASTLLFSLGEGLKASAQAPGGRGTRMGQGAALQAPMVLAQLRQEQQRQQAADQLKQQEFVNNVRQQGLKNALDLMAAQRQGEQLGINERLAKVQETNANKPPAKAADVQEYETWRDQQPPDADNSYSTFLQVKANANRKPESEPAAIQEYKFYANQETAAGRKPLTYDAWQQRPKPMSETAQALNALRDITIQQKTQAAPGQLVFKATNLPVQDVPDTVTTRLNDFNSAIKQSDVVKGLLDKLGSTGAIKGFVLKEGIYWPVAQEGISADAAAAVQETQRLINSYIYAVSGKQINEQEMKRIALTAPDLRFTSDVNQRVLANFKQYVTNQRDGYLNIRGWKFKEETPEKGGGSLRLPDDLRKKILGGQ